MTRLQKRRLMFSVVILLVCLLPFLFMHWAAALVLLVFLAIFLAGPAEAIWSRIQHWPVSPQSMPHVNSEEERPSYQQGYQEVYYQPSVPTVRPQEDQPQAQYPQQYH